MEKNDIGGHMIQDILPHKLINSYDPQKRHTDGSLAIVFTEEGLLIKSTPENDGSSRKLFPRFEDLPAQNKVLKTTYLFTVDEDEFYLIDNSDGCFIKPDGYEYTKIRAIRMLPDVSHKGKFEAFTAKQLYTWYVNNRFCGRCATPTKKSETERALVCPSCGNTIYPRVVPAVIVGVLDKENEKIILTKYNGRVTTNYALVAGFTEIGETFEETVAREVKEEVGLKVKNITYYKSQPWGVADDILAGFFCEVDGDRTITRDPDELSLAEWMSRDEVVLQPDDLSLTNEMMRLFKEGKI
jgi:NAD+ diphosphatase